MEVEVAGGLLVFEAQVCCLECQYLHRPNPSEDGFICLRSLRQVIHELDVKLDCRGFEEIKSFWKPVRVGNSWR